MSTSIKAPDERKKGKREGRKEEKKKKQEIHFPRCSSFSSFLFRKLHPNNNTVGQDYRPAGAEDRKIEEEGTPSEMNCRNLSKKEAENNNKHNKNIK